MERYVVFSPKILQEIRQKKIYKKVNLASVRSDFIYDSRGILFSEDDQGRIELYGRKLTLVCDLDRDSLEVVSIRESKLKTYIRLVEQGHILEGDWKFLDELKFNSSLISPRDSLDRELKNYRKGQIKLRNLNNNKKNEEYWLGFENLAKMEEELSWRRRDRSYSNCIDYHIDPLDETLTLYLNKANPIFSYGDLIAKDGFGILGKIESMENNGEKLILKSDLNRIKIIQDSDLRIDQIYCENMGDLTRIRGEKKALNTFFNDQAANKNLRKIIPYVSYLNEMELKSNSYKAVFLSDDFFETYSYAQREAVIGAITASDLYVIQGPPATGKTRVISEIVSYLSKDGNKILLASKTNLAVDNILGRLKDKDFLRPICLADGDNVELGSQRYLLDRCQLELKRSIFSKLDDYEVSMREKYSDWYENYYRRNYEAHLYVRDHIDGFHRIIASVKNLKAGQRFLKLDLVDLENSYEKYKSNFRLKEVLLSEKIPLYNEILGRSYRENLRLDDIEEYLKLYSRLNINEEELDVVRAYSSLVGQILGKLDSLRALEDEIESLKKQQPDLNRRLSSLVVDISKKIRNSRETGLGLEGYINLEDKISQLNDKREELKSDLDLSNKKLKQLEMLQIKTADQVHALKREGLLLKYKIDKIIDRNRIFLEASLGKDFTVKDFLGLSEKYFSAKESIYMNYSYKDLRDLPKFLDYIYSQHDLWILENQIEKRKLRLREIEEEMGVLYEEFATLYNDKAARYQKFYNKEDMDWSFKLDSNRCWNYIDKHGLEIEEYGIYKNTEKLRDQWRLKLNSSQDILEEVYIKTSNLVCSTCSEIASASNNHFLDKEFDYVIIDEAAKSTSKELLVAMVRGRKIILVGDHKQLSPALDKEIQQELEMTGGLDKVDFYNRSLFESIYKGLRPELKTFLNNQYRMPEDVSQLISREFYDGNLLDGPSVVYKKHGMEDILSRSIYWVNTGTIKSVRETYTGKSYLNRGEVQIIERLLDKLNRNTRGRKTLGIISPYKAQVDELRKIDLSRYEDLDIEINTIDGIQDRDKDVIIFSLVRNNSRGNFGHLSAESRLNVALSRANELIFIVGNREFVVNNQEKSGKIINILNYMDFNRSIIDGRTIN